ncbi:MAG: uL22 family ribosomal protein [Patescibacteria group bacterium]
MEKDFISTQKYLIVGPRKVRDVVALIKKLKPLDAIAKLEFINKKSSDFLIKVIKTAIAQAKVAGVTDTDLIFKEIQIGEGPRLKRGRPASRGRWHPYKKRMCHVRVVLTTREVPKVEKVSKAKKTKKDVTQS